MKMRGITVALLIGVLMVQSGCGLLVSRKRQAQRAQKSLVAALGRQDWQRAGQLMHSSFSYTPYQGRAMAGKAGAKAFINKIDQLKATAMFFQESDTKEISDTKVLVSGKFQVRKSDATGSENRFWEVSLLWELHDKTWLLMELKELSDMSMYRS